MQDTQENVHDDDQEGSINIQKLIISFRSNWYWFLICFASFYLVAKVYLRYAIPVYKVNAKLLIKDEESGSEGVIDQSVLEGLGLTNGKTNLNNEMDILSSVILMDDVVKKLQVNIHYYTVGKFMSFEQYAQFPFKIEFIPGINDSFLNAGNLYKVQITDQNSFILKNGQKAWRGKWNDTLILPIGKAVITKRFTNNVDTTLRYSVRVDPYKAASSHFNKSLTVTMPNKQATFITLTLNETLPERGIQILNKVIDIYLQNNINDKNRIADSTISFINDRLVKVSEDLDSLEKDIASFKRSHSLVDVTQQGTILLNNTDASIKQLNEQEVKLDVVESVEKYINNHKNSPVPTTMMGLEPLFADLVKQYNDLQFSRERTLMSTTEASPMIKSANLQLETIRNNLMNSLASVKRELNLNIAAYKNAKGELSSDIRKTPDIQRAFLEYSRQQAIKQDLYLFLLKTREQTAITKSSSIGNARILEPPSCREGPFSPNGTLTLYTALALALIIPSITIYLKGLFNNRILSKDDVMSLSKITVVGEIGHNGEKDNMAVNAGVKSIMSEQFRFLCTNLQFYLANEKSKVILITSSMTNEGKSFVSLNLSSSLAIIGKKVVVIELDLHRPKISENIAIENIIGFSNYAIGNAAYEEIIRPTGRGFSIISSGPLPPNPIELITLPRIKDLFAKLREDFDYIIIDTPPIGLVADAQVASQYADATLYIVRQRFTFKDQLKIANELYNHKKMPKLSFVINDTLSGKAAAMVTDTVMVTNMVAMAPMKTRKSFRSLKEYLKGKVRRGDK